MQFRSPRSFFTSVKTKNVQKVDSEGIVLGRTTHKSSAEFNSAYESGVMGLQGPIQKIIFDICAFWAFFIFHIFWFIFQGSACGKANSVPR